MTSPISSNKPAGKVPTNAFSVAAFVSGLISLIINIFGLVGLLAFVFGIIGYRQTQTREQKGKGLAIAGMALGVVGIILGIFVIITLATAPHIKG